MSASPSFNVEEAKKFIKAIHGSSESAVTFQVFFDSKEKGVGAPKILHGTIDDLAPQLKALNSQGYAISICPNRTNLRGRKKEDIIKINSFFADFDNVTTLPELPLQPSLVVRSKNGPHPYWKITDDCSISRFEEAQSRIIKKINSDKQVKDANRCMRLPGSLHQKNPSDPFLVIIEENSGKTYTIAEIESAFAANEKEKSSSEERKQKEEAFLIWARTLSTEGKSRNHVLMYALREGLGFGASIGTLEKFCIEFSEKTGLDEKECLNVLRYQSRYHKIKPFISHYLLPQEDHPYSAAKQFLSAFYCTNGKNESTLANWQGFFYAYDEERNYYRLLGDEDVKNKVIRFLQSEPNLQKKAKTGFAKDVLMNIQAICALDRNLQPPCFLREESGFKKNERTYFIPVKNGILAINTSGNKMSYELREKSPEMFSTFAIPHEFKKHTESKTWLQFLEEMLPEKEKRNCLQEWFGYHLLIGSLEHNKFLVLYGSGANGKTVVAAALRGMLGARNTSAANLEQFKGDRPFGLAQTRDKLANICQEMGDVNKTSEEVLREYTDGAEMTFEAKYKDAIQVKPTAKLTFASNHIPAFKDTSDAIWRRLILIVMTKSILDPEKQDRRLSRSEFWELDGNHGSGLLWWAIQGLDRLVRNGRFSEHEEDRKFVHGVKDDQNLVQDFLTREFEFEPNSFFDGNELFARFKRFSAELGSMSQKGKSTFNQEVRRWDPRLKYDQKQLQKERRRGWYGLRPIRGEKF